MSQSQQSTSNKDFVPPSPGDLAARYVRRTAEGHAAGLIGPAGQVELYESGPVQPVDAKVAWQEATRVATMLAPRHETDTWNAPPNWPQLVAAHAPAYDLAYCVGNFPQLVRNFQRLLQAEDLSELRNADSTGATPTPALTPWADRAADSSRFPEVLLALAGLRLSQQFEAADNLIEKCDATVAEEWQALWLNEKAALAWHRGDGKEALRLWRELPDSIPVLFNRGMAALFQNEPNAAKEALARVIDQLDEASAWHHLARLYLTLAESRI